MTVVLLGRDLIIASRVFEAAARAGVEARRVDDPADLPTPDKVRLLLVDWGDRQADWGERLSTWLEAAAPDRRPTVVLFGPHVDLAAHEAARQAGLGPMMARSAFLTGFPGLLAKVSGRA